jgi:hypothetical protein
MHHQIQRSGINNHKWKNRLFSSQLHISSTICFKHKMPSNSRRLVSRTQNEKTSYIHLNWTKSKSQHWFTGPKTKKLFLPIFVIVDAKFYTCFKLTSTLLINIYCSSTKAIRFKGLTIRTLNEEKGFFHLNFTYSTFVIISSTIAIRFK